MNFKDIHKIKIEENNTKEIINFLFEEESSDDEKSEAAEDLGKSKWGFRMKDMNDKFQAFKKKLSSDEAKKVFDIFRKTTKTIDDAAEFVSGGFSDGPNASKKKGPNGIFTSILRYNNPILKKITPEKETIDNIDSIVTSMNFKYNRENIWSEAKFKLEFRKFIIKHPLPNKLMYKHLNDILSSLKGVKGFQVVLEDIRDNVYVEKPAPVKETPSAKKKRMTMNRKNHTAEKVYTNKWTVSFTEFLDNPKWASDVHTKYEALFVEFGVSIRMNKDEIKSDLGRFFGKLFTREFFTLIASLIKIARNFLLVLISVYLMKLLKHLATG